MASTSTSHATPTPRDAARIDRHRTTLSPSTLTMGRTAPRGGDRYKSPPLLRSIRVRTRQAFSFIGPVGHRSASIGGHSSKERSHSVNRFKYKCRCDHITSHGVSPGPQPQYLSPRSSLQLHTRVMIDPSELRHHRTSHVQHRFEANQPPKRYAPPRCPALAPTLHAMQAH